MAKYKTGIIGLRMGHLWAQGVIKHPLASLDIVFDPGFESNPKIDREYYLDKNIKIADKVEEVYTADLDIIIVASPDHFHAEQCIKSMEHGKDVICEKPLAGTIEECKQIIAAVKRTGQQFMTGQVARYEAGFKVAKDLVEQGRIGEICFIESEYAHDYSLCPGYDNWRKDPNIKREGIIGGGCHTFDLLRWLAGDPTEVFCYTNQKFLPDWPTADTGVAVMKFPNGVIGKAFVSIGVKRPYTMRTVINGTKGTIICDNRRDFIELFEEDIFNVTENNKFIQIPLKPTDHDVASEFADFITNLEKGVPQPTDVYQGSRTVALAIAALESASIGKTVKIDYNF